MTVHRDQCCQTGGVRGMSGRVWTENLPGWNLCIPQILSSLCVLVFMLSKGDCNNPLQAPSAALKCAGAHHLLVGLHSQLLPLALGGVIQNAGYLAMDAGISEMALCAMR